MTQAKELVKEVLERQIDSVGLFEVLQAISEICYEKAEHVNDNWQDKDLARCWQMAGSRQESETELAQYNKL